MYLSLVFAVIMSLLLALVEGAAMGAARLQAELVADLGLDSVFAEYHRELFNRYGLFFIDDSYGTGKGNLYTVKKHMEDYMSYNLNPQKGLAVVPGFHPVSPEQTYLEIDEASFATDSQGMVWKAQAVEYMKSRYGMDIIRGVQQQLQTVEREQLLETDLEEQLDCNIAELKHALKIEEVEEVAGNTQEGISYTLLMDFYDSLKGKGILHLTVSASDRLSGEVIAREETVSNRAQQGKINQGCGLPEYVEEPSTMADELIFHEFLMEKYGSYAKEKENSRLKYQIEYILYGRDNDISNLRECAEQLFMLRSVSNYLHLTTVDTAKYREAQALVTGICTLIGLPELAEVITQIVVIIRAMEEAVTDVRALFDGETVPLIKGYGEGLSYEGYLRILLGVSMEQSAFAMRSMDMAELDIRKTQGNEAFRIDQCIDYMKVTFGFTGDRGQEYVFTRTLRYE